MENEMHNEELKSFAIFNVDQQLETAQRIHLLCNTNFPDWSIVTF